MAEPVILASASTARAALLRAAGVDFRIVPAKIDEAPLKHAAEQAGTSAIECAIVLAIEKARRVSQRASGALVIGADQVLAAGAEWFDKPGDLTELGAQLRSLRGRTHVLATAVCVAHDGAVLWQATAAPELTMRPFSDDFLSAYLAAEGEKLLGSVGGYHLEGRGAQLFSRINGDYFAVLGLPLIELLGFLRERGAMLT